MGVGVLHDGRAGMHPAAGQHDADMTALHGLLQRSLVRHQVFALLVQCRPRIDRATQQAVDFAGRNEARRHAAKGRHERGEGMVARFLLEGIKVVGFPGDVLLGRRDLHLIHAAAEFGLLESLDLHAGIDPAANLDAVHRPHLLHDGAQGMLAVAVEHDVLAEQVVRVTVGDRPGALLATKPPRSEVHARNDRGLLLDHPAILYFRAHRRAQSFDPRMPSD